MGPRQCHQVIRNLTCGLAANSVDVARLHLFAAVNRIPFKPREADHGEANRV